MPRKRKAIKLRQTPKAALKLPDLDQAKSAVLNSRSSSDAQRGDRHARDEFMELILPRGGVDHTTSGTAIERESGLTRRRSAGREGRVRGGSEAAHE